MTHLYACAGNLKTPQAKPICVLLNANHVIALAICNLKNDMSVRTGSHLTIALVGVLLELFMWKYTQ